MKKIASLALCLTILVSALLVTPVLADVQRINIKVSVDGTTTMYTTVPMTVEDFLAAQKIQLTYRDTVSPALDEMLNTGAQVTVSRGFYISVVIDGGVAEKYKVAAGTTVGKLITQMKEEKQIPLSCDGSLARVLRAGETITLASASVEYETVGSPILFATTRIETDQLDDGVEKVIQEGVPGEVVSVFAVSKSGDLETSRQLISEQVTKLPVDRIIQVGTKDPQPSDFENLLATETDTSAPDFTYLKKLSMSATAYTCDYASTGKRPGDKGFGVTRSGLLVRRGLVAVDPRVIPLGTKLYIEGYGYAIAADTGSAVKGLHVDLYFETRDACLDYGRRTVDVYVLETGN